MTFDPFNKLDRQMNAHGFIFGPTGSGKSASLTNLICQMLAMYLPRMFVAEAGNSFGLLADLAKRFGLSVHRVRLARAPASAWRRSRTPSSWSRAPTK